MGALTEGYKVRESYQEPHGAVVRRAASVPKEYVLKARKADSEHASRATTQTNSDSGSEVEDLDLDLVNDQGLNQSVRPKKEGNFLFTGGHDAGTSPEPRRRSRCSPRLASVRWTEIPVGGRSLSDLRSGHSVRCLHWPSLQLLAQTGC